MKKTDKLVSRPWTSFASLKPRERLDALLDNTNARAAVAKVPATELYVNVLEVGLADSADIVALASVEQFRAFVDLGGWKKDRVEPSDVLRWIRAARGDSEPEDFLKKLRALDTEVVEILLRHYVVLHDKEENPDVNPEGVTMETPEGKYLVEFRAEGVELAAMRALLNDLLAENPLETMRFLEATRWELSSELEETAYRFRSARLADLGFPDAQTASSLYAYKPESVAGEGVASGAPGAALQRAEHVDYVGPAFAGLDEVELGNLLPEFRELSNIALVADGVDPGSLEAIRDASAKVRDFLSLGLEHLTKGHPEQGADIVRDHTLRDIFQTGFSLTLKLKFRADRFAKSPLARVGGVYLTMPFEASVLNALRLPRPMRALNVEGAEPVPFRNRAELQQTAVFLERAEAQRELLVALLGESESALRQSLSKFGPDFPTIGLDRVFHAVLAHAAVGHSQWAEPFPLTEVPELGKALFEGTASTPQVQKATLERLQTLLAAKVGSPLASDEVRRLVDVACKRLAQELGPAFFRDGALGAEIDVVLPLQLR